MDQYSQPHLKAAASDGEHAIRKAEFDRAVGDPSKLLTWNRSPLTASVNEINDRLNNYTASANFVDLPTQDIVGDDSLIQAIPVEGLLRNQWYDIAYSPELDRCVACADSTGGGSIGSTMYSQNLVQWTHAGANSTEHVNTRCDTICYSNELRMFVGASTQDAFFGYSFDGIKFKRATAPHKGFKAVCWSQELRMFVSVAQAGQYRAAYSYNGIDWTFLEIGQTEIWKAVCWAKELRKFVAVGMDGVCMYSEDGKSWTIVPQAISGLSGSLYNVKWSKSLGKLVTVGLSGTFRGAWSEDAERWTPIQGEDGLSASNEWVGLCVADELGLLIAVARNGTNRIAYTENGLFWTPVGIENGVREDIQWRAAVWVKEKQVLACIGYGGSAYPTSGFPASPAQIMFSFDGKNYFSNAIKSIRGISNKYARHDHGHIDREKGILHDLLTDDKSTLVAAINELATKLKEVESALEGRQNDSAAVLSGLAVEESTCLLDGATTALPVEFCESTTIDDDTNHVSVHPQIAPASDGINTLDDSVAVPLSPPISKTMGMTDEVFPIPVVPLVGKTELETLTIEENTDSTPNKGANMEQLNMQGEIEVVLEDHDGNVKARECVTNCISEAYERYAFYDMLNAGTLSSLLRSNTRSGFNLLTRTLPGSFGIYALDHEIDLKKDTFLPPYVGNNLASIAPGVSFYSVAGSMTESTQEMIPVDQRCYFDKSKKEYVLEYVKNTGVGTVKSVCVGRAHGNKTDKFSVAIAETAVPATWQSGTLNYLLEHTSDRTYLWKTNGSTAWRNDLVTRSTVETVVGTQCYSNISSYFGGLVVGNVVYKVSKLSVSEDKHIVRLTCINNFRSSTAVVTKDITFTCREGMSAHSTVVPVLVYRPDQNKLEVFVSMSVDDHDGEVGCNLQKAVIGNLDDPANLTVEIIDMGILPYVVSNWSTVTIGYFLTGFYFGGKYYLPILGMTNDVGGLITTADSSFQTGVVVSSDFETIHNTINCRTSTASEVNAFVLTDGGVQQCRVNASTIPYVHMSQFLSGSNLPNPVTKAPDDVLRIIYRYRIV